MSDILSDADLDTIFRSARTQNTWQNKEITDVQIEAIYDLMKWGPTSANCSPARFYWARSSAAKEKLAACAMSGNAEKIQAASCTVIIGHDLTFFERLPELFPHNLEAKNWFTSSEDFAAQTAFRNGSLQGAYLMIAARALGFDCGPMSGFDNAAVDEAFFAGTSIKSNFLCCIGYGTPKGIFPRSPRLSFDDANRVL